MHGSPSGAARAARGEGSSAPGAPLGLEQSDGHLVRYRRHGRARVRLPGARGRAPVADTSFDCTVRL